MKKWIAGLAGILLAVTLAGCSSGDSATVANMNGAKITKQEYYDEMKTSSVGGEATLRNMILAKALDQQYGKKVTTKQVTKQYNAVKKSYGTSFASALEQNGLTTKSFKEEIRTSLLSEVALKDLKKVTQKQLDTQWKSYEPKITVQHILVAKKAKAEDIIKLLAKDNTEKNFNALAKKYSTDTGTATSGGKIAAFDNTDTSLDSDFKTAAFKLKQGEYTTTPVKTTYGYHVIRSIKNPGKGKESDHTKELKEQLYTTWESDSTVMTSVMKQVLEKANVSIKDKDLSDVLDVYTSTSSSTASN
ncbi:peptidylprolyl isomerase PrsA [Lacticaseibacillus mingshuiensis]|uniref:Foldase protein PrsA n=1 Tax=Lacticaseibacillus mingshuiensis TaxID=2799574 RepID=A0ABW4CGA6_9LACO|nr:peptidylprolyl isomerase PrsA [Lacticaseibacillus mingshuiensis]